MKKSKGIILCLLLAVMALLAGAAMAETDPIVCSMELDPNKLAAPGKVNVTITISNSGDEDMRDPVVLYDPAAQIVSDFGTNGAALLKAGESVTWTGSYDVTQRILDNGALTYYVKYTLYRDSGEAVDQSQPIHAAISPQSAEADIDVKRTISPTIAREGQDIVVRYAISNTGTVDLNNVTIQENKDIHRESQTIPVLKPGQTAEISYPVTMGKKDLTSGATITYETETKKGKQKYTVEDQTITFGESKLTAKLSSNVKGVVINGTVTLSLELKNTGSVDYSDLRVNDRTLGDVFTNQELKAGKSLTLTRDITVPATAEYQFTVTATDATGTETTVVTDAITVTAVSPEDALNLNVTITADRTEVFEQPGRVRFTISIQNDSQVEAKKVVLSYGDKQIYSFDSIAAGETRTLSRDTALSMAGRYRFTVTAQDPLESTLSFESNEVQIAFSVPTPAPATPTPPPEPTPEPTFAAATIPRISDPSIGAVPKTVQSVLLPVLILAGLLLIGSVVLLIIATKRRADQRKASEAAIDQLERAKRRDYVTPADEEPEKDETPDEAAPQTAVKSSALDDSDLDDDYELPHMKYARGMAQAASADAEDSYSAINSGYYDKDMATGLGDADDAADYGAPEADYDRLAYATPEDETAYAETEDAYAPYDGAGYAAGSDAAYDDAGYATGDDAAYDGEATYDEGYGYETEGYDDAGYDPAVYGEGYGADDAAAEGHEPYDGYADEGAEVDGHVPDDRTDAPAYDDSAFRRPVEDGGEPTAHRRRRSQNYDV